MLRFDETELVEFFEVLPSEQPPEEKEFFGTTIFDIHQECMHMCLSLSAYHDDLMLDLRTDPTDNPFLELHLKEVREVRVVHDKPGPSPVLWITARSHSETGTGNVSEQVVQIEVKPRIRVRVKNWEQ